MICEQGIVTRIDGRHVWVQCRSQAACPRCAEGRGCGGGLIGLVMGDRLHEVRVLRTHADVSVGQCVSLGLRESSLLKIAFAVYGMPIVFMLVAALATSLVFSGNVAAVVAALMGFSGGCFCLRLLSRRWFANPVMQPVMLR